MLEETIDRLNLRNKPSSIFNCDESMATMDRKTEKVVVSHKTKQAYTNERLWISKFNSAPTYISTSLPIRSIWKRWIWLIPYSPTHLMVMWRTTLNFFVVSSTSSLSQTQRISKVQNFSYLMVMAPTFQLIWSIYAEEKTHALPATTQLMFSNHRMWSYSIH